MNFKNNDCLRYLIATSLIVSQSLFAQSTVGKSLSQYIPDSWKRVCAATEVSRNAAENNAYEWKRLFGSNSPSSPFPIVHNIPDSSKAINITCKIPTSDFIHWKFLDLRQWQQKHRINIGTKPANRTVTYLLNVHCSNGANISLPWPMKIEGIRELYVDNCGLLDRDILYQSSMVFQMANELQMLDMRNCISIVDTTSLSDILMNSQGDSINITSSFDCGQDSSLEVFIRHNLTLMSFDEFCNFRKQFIDNDNSNIVVKNDTSSDNLNTDATINQYVKPEDRLVVDSHSLISDHRGLRMGIDQSILLSNESSSRDLKNNALSNLKLMNESGFLELMRKIMNTQSKCTYRKLKYQDESMSSDSFKYLLQFLAYGSEYPVLEVMNYSSVGLTSLPRGFQQWKLHFPRLRYVDLSHNDIPEIKGEDFAFPDNGPPTVFNLQYNNITHLNMDVLKSWAAGGNSHIDAKNNPIHCDCSMKSFVVFLKRASPFKGKLKPYEYVKDLMCYSPNKMRGRKLNTLLLSSLSCPTFEIQIGGTIALAVTLVSFLIMAIVLFRFKAEIRVLLYTRLSVRLPWDADSQTCQKTYDAFISYSNEDARWVFQNIVAVLENPESTIKLNTNSQNRHGSEEINATSISNKGSHVTKSGFKLCLHQRDFVVGMTIMDNILESIQSSRHTIVVMSPNFMKSHWAMEELRQAYTQSLVERTRHLIVVIIEKISDKDMDPLIKRCCKTFTFLEANDFIFKDRLLFSLTTKDRGAKRRDKYQNDPLEVEGQGGLDLGLNSSQMKEEIYQNNDSFSPCQLGEQKSQEVGSESHYEVAVQKFQGLWSQNDYEETVRGMHSCPQSLNVMAPKSQRTECQPHYYQVGGQSFEDVESSCHENHIYDDVEKPPAPFRELSNMWTSSNTGLVQPF